MQSNPYFVKTTFFTFQPHTPVSVNLTSLGVNFLEFFLQAREYPDGKLVGKIKIDGPGASSYECFDSGDDYVQEKF